MTASPSPDIGADPVRIVIVTYNSEHVIDDLLDSIPAGAAGVETRVVVIDNGSTDRTLDVLARRSDCTVIPSTNEGYAGGIMRGVAALRGDGPVFVLNPDVRLQPDCLSRMIKVLHEPRTGVVVPMIRSEDGTVFHSLRREPTLLRATGLTRTGIAVLSESVDDDRVYDAPALVDWALGAVMLISSECFDALGGFDASFFLYSEETDFCLRARDRGWLTRYEPAAVAVHLGGGSGRSARTYAMQAINRVRLYRRRHATVPSWAYYGLLLLREALHASAGAADARVATVALLRPSRRPPELGCSHRVMPR
jgi:N-acetylglucosaminyl-diphospho-decaprenol L-rhamnosyltransferase